MAAEEHTDAMIALLPTEDVAQRFRIYDTGKAEDPDQLHLTNALLGKAADIPEEQQRQLIAAMAKVATMFPPVDVRVFSVNLFNPKGEEPCIVLGCGGQELEDLHNAIIDHMRSEGNTELPPDAHAPWIPHVTLIYTDDYNRYLDDIVESDRLGQHTFDRIRLAFAGINTDIPLTGTRESKDAYMAQLLEEKIVRHVRTPSGERRYGQPIGSIIVGDGNGHRLGHLRVGSDNTHVRGTDGSDYTIRNQNGQHQALRGNVVVAQGSSEEELLRDLDTYVSRRPQSSVANPRQDPNAGGQGNSIPPRAIRRRLRQASDAQLRQMQQEAQRRANASGGRGGGRGGGGGTSGRPKGFFASLLQMIIDELKRRNGGSQSQTTTSLHVEQEEKTVRHVRTPAGVRKYKQPIGTVIVRGNPLQNLTEVDSPYHNFTRVRDRQGNVYDVGYDDEVGSYVATSTDSWDALATGSSLADVLQELDNRADLPRRPQQRGTTRANPGASDGREHLRRVESDYTGYQAYEGSDGVTYHVGRAEDDGMYYATGPGEWDDIVAGPVRTRREALDALNREVSRRSAGSEGRGRTVQEAADNLTTRQRQRQAASRLGRQGQQTSPVQSGGSVDEAQRLLDSSGLRTRARGEVFDVLENVNSGHLTPAEGAQQIRRVSARTRNEDDRSQMRAIADALHTEAPPSTPSAPTGSGRQGTTERNGKRTTRVTLPNGEVAERTSATRNYSHALMLRRDNHGRARRLRESATSRQRAIEEARRRIAANDYQGLERRSVGGSWNSGTQYQGFIPGSTLAIADWGNDRGGRTQARNVGPEPIPMEDYERPDYPGDHYPYRSGVNSLIEREQQSANKELEEAAKLEAGPRYSYGIGQWSESRQNAMRGSSQYANDPDMSTTVVAIDGSEESERAIRSGRPYGFAEDTNAGEGVGFSRRTPAAEPQAAAPQQTPAPTPARTGNAHLNAPLSMDITEDGVGRIWFNNTSYASSDENSIPVRRVGTRWFASELPDGGEDVSARNPQELMSTVAQRLGVSGTMSIQDERELGRGQRNHTGTVDVPAPRTRNTRRALATPNPQNIQPETAAQRKKRMDRLRAQARTSPMAWALLPESERAGIPFPGSQRELWVHRRQVKLFRGLLHELKAITPGGREGDPSPRNLSPRENWVDKKGGLPRYIRFVRNMFLRKGYSMAHATAAAINAVKRWARGGDHVRPQVQAAAAAAIAHWEAMKA